MNRSLYSGLSGTIASQAYIDVLGNNIANANTVGFKEGKVTFQDAFYQTLRGGRAGSESGPGGIDPAQVGSGVAVGQIQVNHTQGSLRYTGSPLDAAIEGGGMFVVQDGAKTLYSRDGSFLLDDTHTLVQAGTGLKVQGWMATDGTVAASGPLTDLVFPIGQVRPGTATSAVTTAGNLDAGLDTGDTQNATVSVYDSLGLMHQVTLTFTKTATANQWTCKAELGATSATGTMVFNGATGALTSGGTLALSAPVTTGATSPLAFDLDLSGLTQLAQTGSTVLVQSQDGKPSATIESVSISEGGEVQGSFSDGHLEVLGKVAVAAFGNAGGLLRMGNNLYQPGADSGLVDIGAAGIASRGQIRSRSLENSNVDLTRSFVEIMTAQRAFQASTRVISAANRLLDDVMQLNVS